MERIRDLEDFGGVLLVQIGGGRSVAAGGGSVIFFYFFPGQWPTKFRHL